MLHGVKPVVAGHLLFCEIGTSHRGDRFPCAFGETIWGLAPGGGANNLGVDGVCLGGARDYLLVDPTTGSTPQELHVAVAAEFLWHAACVSPELFEGVDHAVGLQIPEAVQPDVLGGVVDEEKGEAKSEPTDGVAVNDVQVNFVQVMFGWRECFATVSPAEIGKLAERWAGFAPLDELHVFGNVAEVLVVAELAVAEEMVDLVRREILEGVRPVGGIAAADIRRGCGGVLAWS